MGLKVGGVMKRRFRSKDGRPWWRLKRVWIGLWLLSMPLILAISLYRSTRSLVSVYNETAGPIMDLTVEACEEVFVLDPIPAHGNVRLKMPRSGTPSSVMMRGDNPRIYWQGGFVKPMGGDRMTVYVRADLSVDYGESVAFWMRLFE